MPQFYPLKYNALVASESLPLMVSLSISAGLKISIIAVLLWLVIPI